MHGGKIRTLWGKKVVKSQIGAYLTEYCGEDSCAGKVQEYGDLQGSSNSQVPPKLDLQNLTV